MKDAEREQMTLRDLVRLDTNPDLSGHFRRALAIGTAYDSNSKTAVAVAVEFDASGRFQKKRLEADAQVDFPYVPGLLAFRVGPAICNLLDSIGSVDDVELLLLDGQGIAHPRGFGVASHIGVLYDKPSFGITRRNLYGEVSGAPGPGRTQILHPETERVIGYSVSLGEQCKPLFISQGHKLSLVQAADILSGISGGEACYPPALMRAHRQANTVAKKHWRQRLRESSPNQR